MYPRISAVIVTRGDVDLTDILAGLPFDDVVIWNNQIEAEDFGVYGRYHAIEQARHDVIYVQDDDCLIPAAALAERYEPGRLVANMPESRWRDYPDSTLVGWGAVFDRNLPERAFSRFALSSHSNGCIAWGAEGVDPRLFQRTCDVVFSALTPRTVIDAGFRHLLWAEDPARAMFKQPGHKDERDRMLELCRSVRTEPDDDRRTP